MVFISPSQSPWSLRLRLHDLLVVRARHVSVIHPSALDSGKAVIGDGAQIMAGAIVGAEATLGRQCIINTKASVDHEDILDDV